MKTKLALLTPCLALALGTSPISAAPISWTVHDITNDVTNISTDGTVVPDGARSGSTTDRTVNGVIFESIANSGNLFDSLFANDTINSRGWGSVVTVPEYQNLLGQGQRSGRASGGIITKTADWTTVNFTGLTPGNSYQIQIWYSDNAGTTLNTALVLGDGVMAGSPVFGTDAQLFQETTDGGVGQYGIGVFVADGPTQSFNVQTRINLLTTPAWGNQDHFSNGWQIRDLGVDNSPPSPAPTVATVTPLETSVLVEASTTTTDQTGVEYQFVRRLGLGGSVEFTSGWQEGTTFNDAGLTSNTEYSYTVTARDKVPASFGGPFVTAESAEVAATTLPLDTTPPTPATMSFAVAPNATNYDTITMTATTASDPLGVEYQFTRRLGVGGPVEFTSAWQDSPEFTDTGLNPSTEYEYTVVAQDKSLAGNENNPSSGASAITLAKGTATITWSTFDITDDVANVSTTGTLLDARNGATSDRTLNGVTFLSVANSGNLFDSLFQSDSIGARGYGNVVTDADYRGFLSLGQRSGRLGFGVLPRIEPSEVWTTVEFFGLTPGNTYQIQIWASDTQVLGAASTTDGISKTKALVLGDGTGVNPTYGVDTPLFYEASDPATSNISGPGQYGIGTFVANATNQAFNVRQWINLNTTPAGAVSDHFSNGWQIRDVTGVSSNPFDDWAGTGTLPGTVTFEGDLNGDGVQDGLAFLLGAANPDDSALGLLPTTSETGGDLVMSFTGLATADRGAAALNLEYDGDLAGTWLSVPVPGAVGANPIVETTATGSVSFVATDGGTNSSGDALIDIVATISDATESASGKLFGRLKGTE